MKLLARTSFLIAMATIVLADAMSPQYTLSHSQLWELLFNSWQFFLTLGLFALTFKK